MTEICEKHHVLKRSCYICLLEEDQEVMKNFIQWIAEKSTDEIAVKRAEEILKEI